MSACFICDKSLSEGTVVEVKERGLKSLLLSSIRREEKQHELLLKDSTSISVHRACQKNYADERKTEAAIRRRRSQSTPPSVPSQSTPPSAPSQPPAVEQFDLKNTCFICCETIPIDFEVKNTKTPPHLRTRIPTVKKLSIIKTSIVKLLEKGDKEKIQKVLDRIRDISDVDGAGARYHRACLDRLRLPAPTGRKRTRPGIDEDIEALYTFMVESDECQFKLSELVQRMGDNRPDLRTVKAHLQRKYGEDIGIFDNRGHDAFICLKSKGYKILSSHWYAEKKLDAVEERSRVVKEAAAIILEDIRSQFYDTETYPASDDFMSDVDSAVPESLRLLLREIVVKSKRKSSDNLDKKCTTIAHSIIAAVRPRGDRRDRRRRQ